MRRTIALGLVAAVVLLAAAALPGCGCQKQAVEATSGNIDTAKDAAVKSQLMMIKTGIQAYVASNGSAPPDASQATLGSFVAPWPTNPFDKAPMKAGDGVGDYVYTPGAGTSFTLAVHLSDGTTSTAP
jgi:type II secretory pathway pseudopilin PulG